MTNVLFIFGLNGLLQKLDGFSIMLVAISTHKILSDFKVFVLVISVDYK
jgi:hypothetical protein